MGKYPLVLYFMILLFVFWPLTFGGYFLQYDALDVYLPWRFYGSESLRQGMVPLWNPYQDGGYPFYADHQYSIWNPELFFVSLFTRYNANVIVWLYLLYLAIGATGFRFFAKQFRVNNNMAFLGGLVFMLSGTMIGHAQSVISILGMIWLPWALGSYVKAVRSDFVLKDTLLAALMLFMMLVAGYQAVSIMLFYIIISIFFGVGIKKMRSGDKKALWEFVKGHLYIALIIGLLLGGVFLSVLEVFPHLERLSGLDLKSTAKYAVHPKSITSLLFPFGNAQEEYEGSILSAQNLFIGIPALIGFVFGLRGLFRRKDFVLNVLLIFGVVYGIAALGTLTPLQPFLAKVLPGMNLFFYAVFFRYFSLIALLLVSCFGFQKIIEEQNWKLLIYSLSGFLIIYLITAIIFIQGDFNWTAFLSGPWSLNFYGIGIKSAVYVESVVHILILAVALLISIFFKNKRGFAMLLLLVLFELSVVNQLNMPVTVHGVTTRAEINNYLDLKEEGFPTPDLRTPLSENDQDVYPLSIWRNQGNFSNKIITSGWTSFHLSNRKKAYAKSEANQRWLDKKPLLFTGRGVQKMNITHFNPERTICEIDLPDDDTLYFQQALYPGWKAFVNGKETEVVLANGYQMAIYLKEGFSKVEFVFRKPLIRNLYYFSMFGTILLSLIVWFSFASNRRVVLIVGGIFLVFAFVRILTFTPTKTSFVDVLADSDRMTLHLPTSLSERDRCRTYFSDRKGINVVFNGKERDLAFEAMWTGLYANRNHYYGSNTFNGLIVPTISGFRDEYKAIDLSAVQTAKSGQTMVISGFTSVQDTANVFIVLEQKQGGKTVDYRGYSTKDAMIIDSVAYFYIPFQLTGRELSAYIWNRDKNNIHISEFNCKLLPE